MYHSNPKKSRSEMRSVIVMSIALSCVAASPLRADEILLYDWFSLAPGTLFPNYTDSSATPAAMGMQLSNPVVSPLELQSFHGDAFVGRYLVVND